MPLSPPFLVQRREDLLLLAVRWDGLQVAPGPPTRLVGTDPATVEVTFPPQSIAEVKYIVPGDVSRRPARASGPSRVTFALDGPVDVELSAAGLLGLLASAGRVAAAAIELPWHLISDVAAAQAGVAIVASHAAGPVVRRDVVGLWHTALGARGAHSLDAELLLAPLESDPDSSDEGGLDIGPLNGSHRASVRNFASTHPPRVRRLHLSALGGSLMARQQAPEFSWEHTTSLGRDERVRVEARGVLYPFGHRAELTSLAMRSFEPAGSPTVAGMQRQVVLTVLEPVRSMAGAGRQFPFSEVEILNPSWPNLAGDVYLFKLRPRLPLDDIFEERQRLTEALTGDDGVSGPKPQVQATFDAQRPASRESFIQTLRESGHDLVVELDGVQADLSETPEALREARKVALERKRQIESTPHPGHPMLPATPLGLTPAPASTPPPDGIDEGLAQELTDLNTALAGPLSEASIAQVEAARPGLFERVRQLNEQLDIALMHATDFELFVRDLAAAGDQAASAYLDIIRALEELRVRLEEIESRSQKVPFAWTPRTVDGRYVRFALRIAGALGDVTTSVPLTFVRDGDLPEADHYAPYSPLADPEVVVAVDAEWAAAVAAPPEAVVPPPRDPFGQEAGQPRPAAGTIRLPSVRVDLVRADAPAPGDVHEVHALHLRAQPVGDSFLPALEQVVVDLPAVRTLLPEQAEPVSLEYTRAFLEGGPVPDVALKLAGEKTLPLSFRSAADRSGGLVAPEFAVDAISRSLGPVAAGALPPGTAGVLAGELPDFDLESVYANATLLGFRLTDLIKTTAAGVPESDAAPVIEPLMADGMPDGVSMTWTLALDAAGPFRPRGDTTRLALAVRVTRAGRSTTCTVNDFALVLPPGDADDEGLLTLNFGAVVFTQHDERAPHLDIQGLDVQFGGALKLLDGLREKLAEVIDMPGNTATVEPRADGVTAGFGLSVPSVTAGGFLLRDIAMHAGVDVPFTGDPVSVNLSFATRENPFNVSILTFGGGGYIDLTLGPSGITRLEASMEFGATLEVDFVVARGEVHALGGLRFTSVGGTIAIDGYVRIGGSVEILGLVSVAIELVVNLHYENRDGTDILVGSATIIIEIDVTLFSESVEIDSGEWVLIGGGDGQANHPAPVVHTDEQVRLDEWTRYRDAFDREQPG